MASTEWELVPYERSRRGDFLALMLRTQLRLLAYHLSLVDVYPALAEDAAVHAPT